MKKSMEERFEDLVADPAKFKKAFTLTWVVAYSMLILGIILILWVLLQGL